MGRVFYMKYSRTQRGLRLMVFAALLSALSIVCGKYLAFNMGEFLRFSFENLPIIFAGIAFGPIVGAAVGVVSDLLGCVLVGYAIIPLITVGAGAIGFISGLFYFLPKPKSKLLYIAYFSLTVFLAHFIGSVIIKSFGLSAFYDMPLIILMLWRLLNYVIVGSVEGVLLYHLLRNKMLSREINNIMKRKNTK